MKSTLLLAVILSITGCGMITEGSGKAKRATVVTVNYNGGYTGTTTDFGGGTQTFTLTGLAVAGDIHLVFPDDQSLNPSPSIVVDDTFTATDPFTAPCNFARVHNYTDSNGRAATDVVTGTLTITTSRTFTAVVNVVSTRYVDDGTGVWNALTFAKTANYIGAHNPGG